MSVDASSTPAADTTASSPAPQTEEVRGPVGFDAAIEVAAEYQKSLEPKAETPDEEEEPQTEYPVKSTDDTPAPKAEEPAAADEAIPAKTPVQPRAMDGELVRRAAMQGIDPTIFSGNEAALRLTVESLEKRTGPQPSEPEKPAEIKTPRADKLKEADYDDEIVEFVREQEIREAKRDAREAELQAELEGFKKSQAEQQAAADKKAADEWVANFDKAAEQLSPEIYGKGPGAKLDDKAKLQRIRLSRERQHLERCYAEDGLPVPSEAKLIEEAHARLHPDLIKKQVQNDLVQTLSKRKGTLLPKPNGSAQPQAAETGDEKAIRAAAEFQQEHPETGPTHHQGNGHEVPAWLTR